MGSVIKARKLLGIIFVLVILGTNLFISLVLAQRGYFKDQAFINYLKYLQYWKEPEYAKFLK